MTPDDRIKRVRTSSSGQINAHLVNSGSLGVLCVALMRCSRLAEHLNRLCAHLLKVDTQAFEHTRCDPLPFAHQAQQEMFCTDIMMIQTTSFVHRQLDHLFGTW